MNDELQSSCNSNSTGTPAGIDSERPNRRKFIADSAKKLTVFASASALASLAACSGNSGITDPGGTGTVEISTATYSALQTVGGTVALNGSAASGLPLNGVFIIRSSDSTVTVLSRTCTHQGCQVGAFASNGIATCPCHGAQYNTSGAVTRGPAGRALARYNATMDGEMITINF